MTQQIKKKNSHKTLISVYRIINLFSPQFFLLFLFFIIVMCILLSISSKEKNSKRKKIPHYFINPASDYIKSNCFSICRTTYLPFISQLFLSLFSIWLKLDLFIYFVFQLKWISFFFKKKRERDIDRLNRCERKKNTRITKVFCREWIVNFPFSNWYSTAKHKNDRKMCEAHTSQQSTESECIEQQPTAHAAHRIKCVRCWRRRRRQIELDGRFWACVLFFVAAYLISLSMWMMVLAGECCFFSFPFLSFSHSLNVMIVGRSFGCCFNAFVCVCRCRYVFIYNAVPASSFTDPCQPLIARPFSLMLFTLSIHLALV